MQSPCTTTENIASPNPGSYNPPPTLNQPTARPTNNNRARHIVRVRFADVAAHTAKCDDCDKRNRDGMSRCLACGWQCCRKCLNIRGGDRTHRSFTSIHTPENERPPSSACSSANGTETRRPSASGQEAAQTLVGISVSNTPQVQGGNLQLPQTPVSMERPIHRERAKSEELAVSTDDETLTWVSLDDESDDDRKLSLGELHAIRRNPPRASRPSDLAE